MRFLLFFFCIYVKGQSFIINVHNLSKTAGVLYYTESNKIYLREKFEKKLILNSGKSSFQLPTKTNEILFLRIKRVKKDSIYIILPQNNEVFNISLGETINIKSNQTNAYEYIEKSPDFFQINIRKLLDLIKTKSSAQSLYLASKYFFESNMNFYKNLFGQKKIPKYLYEYYNDLYTKKMMYWLFVSINSWEVSDIEKKKLVNKIYSEYAPNLINNENNIDIYFINERNRMIYNKYLDLDLPKNTSVDWSVFPYKQHFIYFTKNELEIEIAQHLKYGLKDPVYSGSISERLYKIFVQLYPNSEYISLFQEHYSKTK